MNKAEKGLQAILTIMTWITIIHILLLYFELPTARTLSFCSIVFVITGIGLFAYCQRWSCDITEHNKPAIISKERRIKAT